MSAWNVLWTHWLQKGKKWVGPLSSCVFNQQIIQNILPAINQNKCVFLHCIVCTAQVSSTCDSWVQFLASHQRQWDAVLISTPQTRATSCRVAWIFMNVSALPVLYWEQGTSVHTFKHYIRFRLLVHFQQGKEVPKMWRSADAEWSLLHSVPPVHIFPKYSNFPVRKSKTCWWCFP